VFGSMVDGAEPFSSGQATDEVDHVHVTVVVSHSQWRKGTTTIPIHGGGASGHPFVTQKKSNGTLT
jgi:isopentenyl phosphate kinase